MIYKNFVMSFRRKVLSTYSRYPLYLWNFDWDVHVKSVKNDIFFGGTETNLNKAQKSNHESFVPFHLTYGLVT